MPTTASDTVRDALSRRFTAGAATATPQPATPAPAATTTARTPARLPFPRPNGEDYFARQIDPTFHDVGLLRSSRGTTIRDNLYVLFYGAPGTGKTACAEAAFPDLITLGGTGDTTVDDFIGGWTQNPDGTYTWIDNGLLIAMEQGRPFLVDEIARIDTGVLATLYGVMDGRRELRVAANPGRISADPSVPTGYVRAKDGFYVVGTCNPNSSGSRMDEALLSRFLLQIEATTDYDLAKAIGVPPKMVTVAKNLDSKRSSGEVSWAPQMRELIAFKTISERSNMNIAVGNMIGIAPEEDRAIVADVISRAFGAAVANLRQGAAAVA